jgi:hypothetical protein
VDVDAQLTVYDPEQLINALVAQSHAICAERFDYCVNATLVGSRIVGPFFIECF